MSTEQKTQFSDYYRVLAETAEDQIFVVDREDRSNMSIPRQHDSTAPFLNS